MTLTKEKMKKTLLSPLSLLSLLSLLLLPVLLLPAFHCSAAETESASETGTEAVTETLEAKTETETVTETRKAATETETEAVTETLQAAAIDKHTVSSSVSDGADFHPDITLTRLYYIPEDEEGRPIIYCSVDQLTFTDPDHKEICAGLNDLFSDFSQKELKRLKKRYRKNDYEQILRDVREHHPDPLFAGVYEVTHTTGVVSEYLLSFLSTTYLSLGLAHPDISSEGHTFIGPCWEEAMLLTMISDPDLFYEAMTAELEKSEFSSLFCEDWKDYIKELSLAEAAVQNGSLKKKQLPAWYISDDFLTLIFQDDSLAALGLNSNLSLQIDIPRSRYPDLINTGNRSCPCP